ncbi:MAG: hypothetical protein WCL50_00790 [Spirochaetota bacterium]
MEGIIDQEILGRVLARCTWGNTTETVQEWMSAFQGENEDRKRRIFMRLFTEGVDGEIIHRFFNEKAVTSFLETMDRPLFRSDAEKRRKVWRHLYCGKHEPVPELKWVSQRQERDEKGSL